MCSFSEGKSLHLCSIIFQLESWAECMTVKLWYSKGDHAGKNPVLTCLKQFRIHFTYNTFTIDSLITFPLTCLDVQKKVKEKKQARNVHACIVQVKSASNQSVHYSPNHTAWLWRSHGWKWSIILQYSCTDKDCIKLGITLFYFWPANMFSHVSVLSTSHRGLVGKKKAYVLWVRTKVNAEERTA
jgi:hypothetical protein